MMRATRSPSRYPATTWPSSCTSTDTTSATSITAPESARATINATVCWSIGEMLWEGPAKPVAGRDQSPSSQQRQPLATGDLVETTRLHRLDLGEMPCDVAVHARSRVVEDDVLSITDVEADEVVVEASLRDLRREEVTRRDRHIGGDRPHCREERRVARLAREDRCARRRPVRLAAEERIGEVQRE